MIDNDRFILGVYMNIGMIRNAYQVFCSILKSYGISVVI